MLLALQLGLLIAFPLLAHLAVLRESPAIHALALAVLALGLLLPALRRRRRRAWGALAAAGASLAAAWHFGFLAMALYLPAPLLQAAILWAFAGSLAPGRTPLVTQIATATRGPLPPELVRYTRAVTWVWAGVLAAMLATTLALEAAGARAAWSVFTNFVTYGIVAAVFALEYAVRRVRFRALPHPRLAQYLRNLVRHPVRPA